MEAISRPLIPSTYFEVPSGLKVALGAISKPIVPSTNFGIFKDLETFKEETSPNMETSSDSKIPECMKEKKEHRE